MIQRNLMHKGKTNSFLHNESFVSVKTISSLHLFVVRKRNKKALFLRHQKIIYQVKGNSWTSFQPVIVPPPPYFVSCFIIKMIILLQFFFSEYRPCLFKAKASMQANLLLNEKERNKGAFKPNERIKLCVCFPTLWFLQGGFFCSIYGLWLGMRIEMQISKENGWISLLAFFSFGLRKVTSKKCNLKRILRGVQRRLRRLVLIKDDRYWQSFVSFKWHLITFEKAFQFKRQSRGLLLTF